MQKKILWLAMTLMMANSLQVKAQYTEVIGLLEKMSLL
jgi:hypothetical protein